MGLFPFQSLNYLQIGVTNHLLTGMTLQVSAIQFVTPKKMEQPKKNKQL